MKKSIQICLSILALVSATKALAMPSAADIDAAIKSSGDIQKDKKFTARSVENEVQLATYTSSNVDKDCKIDAVLLARIIMNKFSDVSRIAVNFYSTPGSKTFKQVTVTKPEIVAFGSGQVNSDVLLNAIRLEEKTEAGASTSTGGEGERDRDRDRHGHHGHHGHHDHDAPIDPNAVAAMKEAIDNKKNPEEKWTTYKAPGLSFNYPAVWSKSREFDGDTIVNFKSSQTTYKPATIGLKIYRSAKKEPVMETAREHAQGHQRYRNFKIVDKSKVIRFGAGNALTGVLENFSYSHDGTTFYERHIYFGWPGYVYKIFSSASRDDYAHINNVFNHLLGTVRIEAAAPAK